MMLMKVLCRPVRHIRCEEFEVGGLQDLKCHSLIRKHSSLLYWLQI